MFEHDTPDPAPEDEARIRQLLSQAGERPVLPADDLAAIAAAARTAWQEQLAVPLGEAPPSERPWVAVPARPAFPRRLAWGLAAALVAAVGVGGWWLARHETSGPPAAQVASVFGEVTLEAPAETGDAPHGEVRLEVAQTVAVGSRIATAGEGVLPGGKSGGVALRLAGGASVRLAGGTTARLVSPQRLELESGAIYVDSEGTGPAARGGVEIATVEGVVREIGTQFSVRRLPATKTLEVRVREGEVQVRRSGDTVAAGAGSELVLGAEGPVRRRQIPAHGAEWEWVLERAPEFAIEGRTLGEFLHWIGRETGWKVELSGAAVERSVGEVVLHGRIMGLRPDRAALVVLSSAELTGEISDGVLRIDVREDAGH